MLLYHGSAREFSEIPKSQAQSGGKENVPEGELLDAIYLTPSIGFATAVAAMPEGGADIEEKTIEFEHPELFDPEKEVFVYEIDSDKIPKENLRQIDELQYAVVGLDKIHPDAVRRFKAEEVLKYYELTNRKKEGQEIGNEIKFK
jgi:hypothetical protein